ncbi:F-box protein, partial [Aspergillus ibericus CBS 121593]
ISPINPSMATNLPLELVHSILDYVDVETYVAARSACRLWRNAASLSSILRSALKETPVPIPPRTDLLTNEEWNIYFDQVACSNLLGHRTHIDKTESRRDLPEDCTPTTVLAASSDGQQLVTLKGARATVYSRSDKHGHWESSLSSSLYPLWTSVCHAMMDGGSTGCMSLNQRYAKHRLAISSQGHLVAVGLGKTVQIYSLSGDADGISSPAEYTLNQSNTVLASPTGAGYEDTNGVIESLEFTDDDTLLRVAISNETTAFQPTRVRYVGNPPDASNYQRHRDLQYWRNNIHHIYLDSASMAVTLGAGEEKIVLRGLRLLSSSYKPASHQRQPPPDPSSSSHYFTASLQSPTTKAYCIGLVTVSLTSPQTVTLTRLLPSHQYHPDPPSTPTSKPSSSTSTSPQPTPHPTTDTEYITTTLQTAIQRWNPTNLPSANTTTPLLALSPDNTLLVIYEPGAGHSPFASGGALYVYSIIDHASVYKHSNPDANPVPRATTPTELQNNTNTDTGTGTDTGSKRKYPPPDDIPAWSFLLDVTTVDVEEVRVIRAEDGGYVVSALAGRDVLEWWIH